MESEHELIRAQLQRIEQKGALGRSRSYSRLLTFLVHCRERQRVPKELEIAMEVFGKGADFDPTQDSMVRVYTHNLRQKLERYYAKEGAAEPRQLSLAKGEYRILLRSAADRGDVVRIVAEVKPVVPMAVPLPSSEPPLVLHSGPALVRLPPASSFTRHGAALVAILLLGIAVGFGFSETQWGARAPAQAVAAAPLWASLLDDSTPVLVVVGDYYIFGELDEQGDLERMVRHFDVNSSKDLDELMMYNPALIGRYSDLDLTYLPRGAAVSLVDVLRVLYTRNKPVRITSASDLTVADLKSNHVVYVGYISGLGMLEDFVFASSNLSVGDSYDELRDAAGGRVFTGGAGIPGAQRNYRDYGLLSAFPGPNGNQFLIVAGMRDAGMLHAAHAIAVPAAIREVERARPDARAPLRPAFEMLFEVTGSAGTNLDAMLVHKTELDAQRIWGGHFLHAEVAD